MHTFFKFARTAKVNQEANQDSCSWVLATIAGVSMATKVDNKIDERILYLLQAGSIDVLVSECEDYEVQVCDRVLLQLTNISTVKYGSSQMSLMFYGAFLLGYLNQHDMYVCNHKFFST